ncbi:MAG: BON domain-containing protein [Pirellulaceae bacterium]|nr:MAG: BON domain-containing protein [Pirellulaceae bacterium]
MRRMVFGLVIALAAMTPGGLRADDQQIAQKIVTELKALQAAGKLRGFKIDLTVEDGTVLMKGRVASREQQALALEVAQKTSGVKQVVNDLQVQAPATSATRTSTEQPLFTNPLKSARAERHPSRPEADSMLPPSNSAAPAANPTPAASQPAVPPVHIEAAAPPQAPPARPVISDEQIARQIYDRLQQYKQAGQLHGFRLDMRVQDGTVILDGYVPEAEQKTLALEVARRVPGVYQVVDMIRIEPPMASFQTVSTTADSARRRVMPESTPVAQPAPAQPNVANRIQPSTSPAAQQPPLVPSPEPALQPLPQSVLSATPQPNAQPLAQPVAPMAVVPVPSAVYYNYQPQAALPAAQPIAAGYGAVTGGIAQVRYDHPQLPNYAWPSYAAYPNYAAVTYPKQYSPAAWPYIGPFYPYPQVPLGWRKVTLEWDDGWWQLDFKSK